MSQGGKPERVPTRTLEGIPGTVSFGFKEKPIVEQRIPPAVRRAFADAGIDIDGTNLKHYMMGACSILNAQEPAGMNSELLWHMTISTPSRHPTWDEIKVARYRLLPLDLCFGMFLPPPRNYVNLVDQDHVFHLWEVTDPRMPWTAG